MMTQKNQATRRKVICVLSLIPSLYCSLSISNTENTNLSLKGSAELGVIVTSGNTETQTVNAKGLIEGKVDRWRHTLHIDALSASDKEKTTAEKYTASLKHDYNLSRKQYLFILLDYEKDRFSGYRRRRGLTIGYGHNLIDEPTWHVDVETGPGARQSKLDNGEEEDEVTFRVAGTLRWNINAHSELSEELAYIAGEETNITKSTTALTTQLIGGFATKISFTSKYTSDVPENVKKQDTETSITLVYKF